MQLRQKLSSGLEEREGREEAEGFGHKQGVASRVEAAAAALTTGHAGQRLGVRLAQTAHQGVHAGGGGRRGRGGRGGGRRGGGRRGVVLHVMHLGESLHGGDDLSAGHLLVKGVDEAVGARAVIEGHGEGVELRLEAVGLRAEGEASGQAELSREERRAGRLRTESSSHFFDLSLKTFCLQKKQFECMIEMIKHVGLNSSN